MNIRCVITDDEPFARKGLQSYIEKINFLELVGVCEDAVQLNSFIKSQSVDLLFLDIEMPYLSGIELLKNLVNPPKVIFTTAYDKYAIQGFELEVIDYLLKPISFDRFLKASNKAFEYFDSLHKTGMSQEFIFVKSDNKLEKIFLRDIYFIESMENYVSIQTRDKKFITYLTLKMLQEKLSPNQFIQTHKSFLVKIDHINSIEGNILHIHEFQVPVSKYQKQEVLDKILQNKLLKK